ncbi:MAG: Quinone oxidoreductase [uncultured Thermomicrobiales bacterium]|uniref:Quinone oxidoreductase n=1 Tax=uncultured Thermomicrobiales bacterium TaxID=1645740 RepID=A0A6J4V744_9BACT|nr:MAG: Quinone oxidoreductase [uncultured Thermomicrobiales bacterium]
MVLETRSGWMQAVRANRFGQADVFELEDVPMPQPGPGQVLIRVESAAVNFADVKRRRSDPYPFPTSLPYTPGGEVAGTVEELGDGVDGLPVGTPVFALVGNDGSSGYAQFALASAPQVIPIPPGLSPDVASGLVIAGSAALLILREAACLRAGESVLVQGAAGGVGGYAVQIAKLLGAGLVIGAAGTHEKRAAALALGADLVVDYTQADWPDRVRELTNGRGVEVLLEMAGGATFERGITCLAPFGRVVVYGSSSGESLQMRADTINTLFYDPSPNQSLIAFNLGLWFGIRPDVAVDALTTLIGFVASGQVDVPIGHVLPLSRAADAHRMLEERRSTGKIILKPWATDR